MRRSAWLERGRQVNGDITGAFSALLIAIPQSMSLGILAFAALGPAYASAGMVAALMGSAVGNLVAAATSTVRCQIVGLRASATAVVAGLVATLAAHPEIQSSAGPDVARILALVGLTVVLAGIIAIGFGLGGLGRAIKFMPQPVVAGFMNGIALIILLAQLRPVLGLAGSAPLAATLAELGQARLGTIAVAAATVVAIFATPRLVARAPPLSIGLMVGTGVFYLIEHLNPGGAGAVVGALPTVTAYPHALADIAALDWSSGAWSWVLILLPTSVLLATVCALDGLLAALVADSVTGGRHDSNRELVNQGVTNMLVSAFGALPVAGNGHAPIANHLNGGRTRLSTLLHGLFLLAVLFGLGSLIAGVPIAALAGVMVYIGLRLIDGWTRDLVRRSAIRAQNRGDIMLTFAVVLVVTLSMVLANVMVAIGLGFAGAAVHLLAKLSGSPVRRSFDGATMTSLKVRDPAAVALLRAKARQVRVLELHGELFFGTADRLQAELDALDGATRFVVLDFRRVHQIDSSGARTLEVISRRAARSNVQVLLSHINGDEPRGRYLRALGLAEAVAPERWFADLDHALEWAENRILEAEGYREPHDEIDLAATTLFAGLNDAEVETLRASLERFELADGEPVFLEGDDGDRLYVLTCGTVEIRMRLDAKNGRRLTAFNPGVPFGEMALLEGKRRSADAYAAGPRVVLYALAAARFEQLVHDHPDLGLKIYRNLGRHLAWRLRGTSDALRALE